MKTKKEYHRTNIESASSPFFLVDEGDDASEAVMIDTQSFRVGGGDDGRASGAGGASSDDIILYTLHPHQSSTYRVISGCIVSSGQGGYYVTGWVFSLSSNQSTGPFVLFCPLYFNAGLKCLVHNTHVGIGLLYDSIPDSHT